MEQEIGIERHAPQMEVKTKWDYNTLANAPAPKNPENEWVTSIYRGLIPAKNIEKRDFAIAGATVWNFMDLLKPGNPRRVMLGMSLQMWSRLCGMNVMIYVFLVVMIYCLI
jgi:hypothetical protein